jgi:hypothetical protein
MNELDKVRDSYERGDLESLRIQLESFISYNKDNILQFKIQEELNWNRPLDLATAMKLFILKVRTIDTEAEMRDQIIAINRESEGADSALAEQNVRYMEWIEKNAIVWRGFRVLAIIYVFDQNQQNMMKKIEDN